MTFENDLHWLIEEHFAAWQPLIAVRHWGGNRAHGTKEVSGRNGAHGTMEAPGGYELALHMGNMVPSKTANRQGPVKDLQKVYDNLPSNTNKTLIRTMGDKDGTNRDRLGARWGGGFEGHASLREEVLLGGSPQDAYPKEAGTPRDSSKMAELGAKNYDTDASTSAKNSYSVTWTSPKNYNTDASTSLKNYIAVTSNSLTNYDTDTLTSPINYDADALRTPENNDADISTVPKAQKDYANTSTSPMMRQ
ncbi:hypothetical protein BDK51DRAFT_47673 [Blyttiomyces helicus]|uniref:Uncharacterized protein n=1 Tax=Blyttiomyces helicus TaxID=388810 RepID=A0A4P9WP23_9FUNG|nr:hypothetical protein BDK51DRAFT_47673 [Blyttiomyces helicus]|eukprot:RKO93468.1 hypothetical protein BDK51DRAFT_47673 [Blyttiomyces helicus]